MNTDSSAFNFRSLCSAFLSTMAFLLWGSLLLQAKLSHGDGDIKNELRIMKWIYYFASLPLICGDVILFRTTTPSGKEQRRSRTSALIFMVYEVAIALGLVYYVCVNRFISYGLLDWKNSVRADARGF